MNNWKKAGLIGLGAVLGVLLSLNFSVIAQREAKLPIPYEDLQLLSAVFGGSRAITSSRSPTRS
jgi:carboxyl-terminal processing protease